VTAVDAVIVAYRSDAVIEQAVTAAQALGGDVVVVDHGDGASARLAALAGATVLQDRGNPGFGTGQNLGFTLTNSEYVLVCNPDARIIPEAVRAGASLLDLRPDVAAVQGVILNRATGAPERSAGVEVGPVHLLGRAVGARGLLRYRWVSTLAARSKILRDHVHRVPLEALEADALAATAVLVRRAAFEAVGGFDQAYFLYGEDLDLCRRLRQAGWKLVTMPDVWAVHVSGGSAESAAGREAQWWRGTMQFGASWWGHGAWRVAILAAGMRWCRLAVADPRHAGSSLRALVLDPLARRRDRSRPACSG
jgi:N-acetylglucosaminyl-diphospho-decaprenol L-rhamnosyltransferase